MPQLLSTREHQIRSIVRRLVKHWRFDATVFTSAALSHIAEAVVTADASGRINFMNTAAQRLTGLRFDEISGSHLSTAFTIESTGGIRVDLMTQVHDDMHDSPGPFRHALLVTGANGGLTIEYTIAAIHDESGMYAGTVLAFRDIAGRRAAELALQASEESRVANTDSLFEERERSHVTLNAIGDAVVSADFSGRVTFTNIVAEQMIGWKEDDATGQEIDNVFVLSDGVTGARMPCPVTRAIIENRTVSLEAQVILRHRDGSGIAVEGSASPIHDKHGGVIGAVMVVRDVTEARDLSVKLERLALHDSLTDLPNRSLFTDRLDRALARACRDGTTVVLFFVDLDQFKPVNDTLGHALGDRLLQSVADRLRNCVRQSDTVSRFGGDEFLILLPDVANGQDIAICAEKILRCLERPHEINSHEVRITGSVGVAQYPRHAGDRASLMKCADVAMYVAKSRGGNRFEIFEDNSTLSDLALPR